jgi:hypothetical protein
VRLVQAAVILSRVKSHDTGALVRAAARNNADWCGAVCQTHGIVGIVGEKAWTSARRTPSYYPDAVTLHPDVTTLDVLSRIDAASPGCSVKDSFATLDLGPAGFGVLFDAEWIYRPAGVPVPPSHGMRAEQVRTAGRLRDWQVAWRGASDPPDVFRPGLLSDPGVRIVAVQDGDELTGGGVLNFGAGMIGVTNVFAIRNVDPGALWSCLLTVATEHFPGVPIVGDELQDDLVGALQVGFRVIGPLRVWTAGS